jgi:hypothetical protein
MSVLSIMANVFVLSFHHKDADNHMPRWFEFLFCEAFPKLLRIKIPPEFRQTDSSSITKQYMRSNSSKVNKVSNNSTPITLESNVIINSTDLNDSNEKNAKYNDFQKCTEEILNELEKIYEVLSEKNNKTEKNKWKFAAKVIDRVCLVLFCTFFLLSMAFILLTSKNFYKSFPNDHM